MKTRSTFEPLVIIIIITTILAQGDAQSFKCDNFLSKPLCPGAVAQCSCVITVNASFIRWNFTNLDVCPSSQNLISLSQVCTDNINGSCGPYLHAAKILSGSNLCNTSILTIEADTSLDGLIIECRDPNAAIYPGALVGSVNVTIAAAPGPLAKLNGSVGADWLMVSWTPPTIVPLQNYRYNVSYSNGSHTSSPVVIADNGSSVYHHNFTGLISDTLYNVSVVAINCAGSSNVETLSNRTLSTAKTAQSDSALSPGDIAGIAVVAAIVAVVAVAVAVIIGFIYRKHKKSQSVDSDGDDEDKKKK